MSEDPSLPTPRKRDTVLRVVMLGTIYALAIAFVVALSPSMGFVTPHPVGEIGRVAAAPEPGHQR